MQVHSVPCQRVLSSPWMGAALRGAGVGAGAGLGAACAAPPQSEIWLLVRCLLSVPVMAAHGSGSGLPLCLAAGLSPRPRQRSPQRGAACEASGARAVAQPRLGCVLGQLWETGWRPSLSPPFPPCFGIK